MKKPLSQINNKKVIRKDIRSKTPNKFNNKNFNNINSNRDKSHNIFFSPKKQKNDLDDKLFSFKNKNINANIKQNNNKGKLNQVKKQNENKNNIKPFQAKENILNDFEKKELKKNFIISRIMNEFNSEKKIPLEGDNKKKPQVKNNIKKQNIKNPKKENLKKKKIFANKKAKYLKPKKEIKEQKQKNNKDGKKIKIISINDLSKSPILIGLNNIGATCFMNSTLQCLSQTKELTNYFINEKNKEKIINNNIASNNKNALQLSPVFADLIQKLWDKNGPKSFSPNAFMNTVNDMNPLFKTGQAGDAKDFIIFILEQLHKELKKPIQLNNVTNVQPLDQYNRDNSFNYFFNDFKNNCSIISDIFFGFTETTNECLNCKNKFNSQGMNNPICYNYGIFNCLIFPLEEVKNMNQICNNNNQINNNRVSLYDCFAFNQKSELFTGENRNYCNICKLLFDSIYTSKIFISPNVLILILNRGKGNIYDVKLDFSEEIDITQFATKKDVPQLKYNLYGVITHIGQNGPNAHFIASCKSPIDNKWYRYNDAFVNPITNLQKEVIEFGTPYILFYKKNLIQ